MADGRIRSGISDTVTQSNSGIGWTAKSGASSERDGGGVGVTPSGESKGNSGPVLPLAPVAPLPVLTVRQWSREAAAAAGVSDEIVQQLHYVRDWGGKFIVPIPEVTVIP